MSERQTKAPTMSALLPSRLVPEDMLSEWQGPNLPNTKNYAPAEDSIGGMIRNALLTGVAGVGGFTGLPISDEGNRAALLGELLAAGMPLVGGVKQLAKLVGAENKVAQGIKAYHGSPHDYAAERLVRMLDGSEQYLVGRPDVLPDVPSGAQVIKDFPLGRQRLDKIGTGEGAQAYGHGLYQAEGEDVATGYRDALAPQFEVGGKPVVSSAQLHNDPEAINRVQDLWGYINSLKMDDPGSAKLYAARLDAMESTSDEMRQLVDSWQRVKAAPIGQINKGRGHMYEVNINADPEDFLDWDAPLSQQSEKVRQKLAGHSPSSLPEGKTIEDVDGKYLYRMMLGDSADRAGVAGAAGAATEQFSKRGIPGIKYLDGASRPHLEDVQRGIQRTTEKVQRLTAEYQSSPTEALANRLSDARQELESAKRGAGDLKRNYVVFDDKLISIVRKYGIAAALSAGAINEMQARQMQAQGYQ